MVGGEKSRIDAGMVLAFATLPSPSKEGDARANLSVKVSNSFAAMATSSKEGESTFEAKAGVLERQLREAEKKAVDSQVSRCHREVAHGPRWPALTSKWGQQDSLYWRFRQCVKRIYR